MTAIIRVFILIIEPVLVSSLVSAFSFCTLFLAFWLPLTRPRTTGHLVRPCGSMDGHVHWLFGKGGRWPTVILYALNYMYERIEHRHIRSTYVSCQWIKRGRSKVVQSPQSLNMLLAVQLRSSASYNRNYVWTHNYATHDSEGIANSKQN